MRLLPSKHSVITLAWATFLSFAGCHHNDAPAVLIPATPQAPTSWKQFQEELAGGGYKLTTLGTGKLRPGSLVTINDAGHVVGTPWEDLGNCVKSSKVRDDLPRASTEPVPVGSYNAGESSGISISGSDLTQLFGYHAGAESVRAGSFRLNQARTNTAPEGGYARWISENQAKFLPFCAEGPKLAELHVVTGVFEADFAMTDLNFSSDTASGFALVKEVLSLRGGAYKVKLSSAALGTQGNFVPMAAQVVPLEKFMQLPETPAPFTLDDEEKKLLSGLVDGLTAGELWNSAFRVSLSATFLVEPGTITAIMEVQGQLRDAVNPGRISTGRMAGGGSRLYLDGQLKTPTHRVIAPNIEAAELAVGRDFELVTVREFPYQGCKPGQAWEKLALPITFKNTRYVQVQFLSTTGAPKDAMICAARGDEGWKAHVLQADKVPVKTSDVARLRQLLESKKETALAGKVARLSFARSPGWVLKPRSAKLSDVLLAAFTCP